MVNFIKSRNDASGLMMNNVSAGESLVSISNSAVSINTKLRQSYFEELSGFFFIQKERRPETGSPFEKNIHCNLLLCNQMNFSATILRSACCCFIVSNRACVTKTL